MLSCLAKNIMIYAKKHLPEYLFKRPSMFKLINFLNSKDMKNIKSLAFFIHNVFIRYEKNELFAE